jgi:hypothetical protein
VQKLLLPVLLRADKEGDRVGGCQSGTNLLDGTEHDSLIVSISALTKSLRRVQIA